VTRPSSRAGLRHTVSVVPDRGSVRWGEKLYRAECSCGWKATQRARDPALAMRRAIRHAGPGAVVSEQVALF